MTIPELVQHVQRRDDLESLSQLSRAMARLGVNGRDKEIRELVAELNDLPPNENPIHQGYLLSVIDMGLALDRALREQIE